MSARGKPLDLDRAHYLSFATFRASGVEVRTPVWFARFEDHFYVFTLRESGKVKRLRRSTRARIAPCDMRGAVLGPWRDVTARLVTDPPLIESAHAVLRVKYGARMRLADFFARLTGRMARRAWIEIELP